MTAPTNPEPTIPDGGDVSAMTFEQALFATTGGGIDLHAQLKNSATAADGWFTMGGEGSPGVGDKQEDGQSGGSGYSYHAWDKWYVSVDWNKTKTDQWSTSVNDVDKLIQEMQDGKSGKLDVNMLWGAKAAVDNYVNWLTENHTTMQNWVNKLTSDDSAFKGKAAHAIRQSLDNIASSIEDLRTQIVEERATSQGLETVAHALNAYIRGMTQIWYDYVNELRTIVHNTMNAVVNNVSTYMSGMGLYHGTSNYALDMLAAVDPDNRTAAEAYIKYVVDNYSSTVSAGPEFRLTTFLGFPFKVEATGTMIPFPNGPGPLPPGFGPLSGALDNKNTWNDINTKISNFVMEKMEPMDVRAREVITSLENAYKKAKDALLELEPPTPLTPGGGGGGGNNPWDILNNQPPPGGGGNPWDILNNQPPPGGGGGGGNNNPFDILNNQPPPGGGGGGGGNNNPFDILNNQPPPGGGGGGGSDNPFDSLSNQPPPGGGGGGSDNPFSNLPGDNAFSNNPGNGSGNGPENAFTNNPGNGGGNGSQLPPFVPPGGLSAFTNGGLNNNRPGGFQLDANGNPIGGNGSGDFQTQSNLPGGNNLPGGSNLQDFSNLPGGGGDLSNLPGNGRDFSNLPGGNGDFSNLPGGNGDFSNLPGGNGDFSNLPGGNGDFSNLPGGNGDFSNLPGGGGDFSNLPGGGGDFSNLPGGGGDLGGLPGGGAGGGLPGGGDFSNLPGGGGDLGGLPGGGAGGGAPGGGAGGGFGGEGWSDWSGQQDQNGNGNGSPFSSTDNSRGMGGMPMMPPMMPPQNQGDSKERERQTWLSEDDKVWGTDSFAGSGVIGLPSDLVNETDEPLAPTHVHVSTTAPRGKPADQKPAEETTERAEQTATS